MINEIKHSIKSKNSGNLIRCFKSLLNPTVAGKIVFFKNHHRKIDYKNPTILDEKLLAISANEYYKNPLITKCADKYAVREYIEEKGLGCILNELIGVYDNTDEIDWNALPNQFAIKCNHGSGYNIVVTNKADFNKDEVFAKLNYWLEEDYSIISAEHQYHEIPRKIIIEKYLTDYKAAVDSLLLLAKDLETLAMAESATDTAALFEIFAEDNKPTARPKTAIEPTSANFLEGDLTSSLAFAAANA